MTALLGGAERQLSTIEMAKADAIAPRDLVKLPFRRVDLEVILHTGAKPLQVQSARLLPQSAHLGSHDLQNDHP